MEVFTGTVMNQESPFAYSLTRAAGMQAHADAVVDDSFWRANAFGVAVFFLVLMAFDVAVAYWTKARWFWVHVCGNAFVVWFTAADTWRVIVDPDTSLERISYDAINMVVAIHIYHIVFWFKKLDTTDWMHHLMSVGIAGGVTYAFPNIRSSNGLSFFLCGLPGGLDYVLLACGKHGWMNSMTEKKWNTYLNIVIRMPGTLMVLHSLFIAKDVPPHLHDMFYYFPFIAFLDAFNCIYFAQRVVGNYHVCYEEKFQVRAKAKLKRQEKAAKASSKKKA